MARLSDNIPTGVTALTFRAVSSLRSALALLIGVCGATSAGGSAAEDLLAYLR